MDSLIGIFGEVGGWQDYAGAAMTLSIVTLAGLLGHIVLFSALSRVAARTRTPWDQVVVKHTRRASKFLIPLLGMKLVLPALTMTAQARGLLGHVLDLLLIGAVAYLLVGLVRLLRDYVLAQYDIESRNNLSARKIYTQVRVLERILYAVIMIASVSFMLMTFEGVRRIGVSILASAGVAGVVLGLAAQKSLGLLLAGIQIAITQPIRLEDVVVVEGEWGSVKEITMTYVVVQTWDLRDIVLPITWFIENSFENWTRHTSEILGTVFVYADYTLPVDPLREEFDRLLNESGLWDGKVATVQITDNSPGSMEVRFLMSAEDAGRAWELRCFVREHLIVFIRDRFPESLPRLRAEVEGLKP